MSRLALFSVTFQCSEISVALVCLLAESCSKNHCCLSFTGTFIGTFTRRGAPLGRPILPHLNNGRNSNMRQKNKDKCHTKNGRTKAARPLQVETGKFVGDATGERFRVSTTGHLHPPLHPLPSNTTSTVASKIKFPHKPPRTTYVIVVYPKDSKHDSFCQFMKPLR